MKMESIRQRFQMQSIFFALTELFSFWISTRVKRGKKNLEITTLKTTDFRQRLSENNKLLTETRKANGLTAEIHRSIKKINV